MYKNKTIAINISAYNEEDLIGKTISTLPSFVDYIIVVNDGSKDTTLKVIHSYSKNDSRITVINHEKNCGLGQAIISGYSKALELEADITVIMNGDAQMCPSDLTNIIEPLIDGTSDYTKGNRLLNEDVTKKMPLYRFLGNSVLSLLTKFATGYWRVIDPQCAYSAISLNALKRIPFGSIIKGYGYNANLLYLLNLDNFRVHDVEVKPIYSTEKSGIKLPSYISRVSVLLIKLFFQRITKKYMIREFHPLFLFYFFSFFNFFILVIPLTIRFLILYHKYEYAPHTTLILLTFTCMMAFFSLFFGMWMDMEVNKPLEGN